MPSPARLRRVLAALVAVVVVLAIAAGSASAQATARAIPSDPGGAATGTTGGAAAAAPAPASPTTPGTPATTEGGGEDNVHGMSSDLLTGNGLSSPWCAHPVGAAATANCATGGLASTGASGDNTNFDTHIDTSSWTGAPKITEWFLSVLLSIIGFIWSGMVLLTRGVFVALEFAFGFNPLDTSHAGSIGADLNREFRTVTRPIALLLAPAGGIWMLWTAAANRRHGHALRHMALSTLLIMGVTIVLSNPIGTVGALLTSSQKVGLAVISLTAGGSPSDGTAQAQTGLRDMADAVIDQPLSLLEFGNVAFGTDRDQLDPKLKQAALKMAVDEGPKKVAAVSAARTNLDLFQVWPANSSQRNAINDEGSLLRVLCGSDKDTDCKGDNAKYAEFRTEQGAWQRAIALLLIALGLIPFWIALLFCAVKIIGAAIMTVIRLIQLTFIGPLAVVGETGNRRVIALGGDLIGGILAAAAYSCFLGLVMSMWRIVTHWDGYGFVMQWLLLILTLWLLILHRDRLAGAASAPGSAGMGVGGFLVRQAAFRTGIKATSAGVGLGRKAGARVKKDIRSDIATGAKGVKAGTRLGGRAVQDAAALATGRPRPSVAQDAEASAAQAPNEQPREHASPAGTATAAAVGGAAVGASAGRPSERRVKGARRYLALQNERVAQVSRGLREQRIAERPVLTARELQLAGELARVAQVLPGTTGRKRQEMLKRQASLTHRHQNAQQTLKVAQAAATNARDAERAPDRDRAIRAEKLDRQAALPRGMHGAGQRRNYAGLAPMLGATPAAYRAASAPERLKMRADIDRQLGKRQEHRKVLEQDKQHRAATPKAPSGPTHEPQAAAAPAVPATAVAVGDAPDRPGPRGPGRRPARSRAGRRDAFRQNARRRD